MIEARTYRVEVERNNLYAHLSSPEGEELARLSLFASFDRLDARDETLSLETTIDSRTLTVERRSTIWGRAVTTIECRDDELEIRTSVEGEGRLGVVRLLGGRSLVAGAPIGLLPSGANATARFTPNPGDPGRLVLGADENAVVGVAGDGGPGRGHWFFTPAPLAFALQSPSSGWLGIAVVAPVEELRFVEAELRGGDRAFHLVLDYEGQTTLRGRFDAPAVVLSPGLADGYEAVTRYRATLESRGLVPERTAAAADWWSEPIFCGWGAQCALDGPAADNATQTNYDAFLAALDAHDVRPGTVVLDDKWQAEYGTNEPDEAKWPDLKRWIAERHADGRRVLLWWKAWDPEGLPPELCVRTPAGTPVAFDPTNADAAALLRRSLHALLAPEGLDADGLKVDFTARTPAGAALELAGDSWGIALLHELLRVVYAAAKDAKPDALVITQTPHPGFVDVTDMIRLNDMLRLDDPGPLPPVLPQMRHRAAITAAACPELLIDTDDWTIPDKRTWRAYVEEKLELGVPSLYYATRLDLTGEELDDDDFAALRASWQRWRSR
jgi:hypothetical protein